MWPQDVLAIRMRVIDGIKGNVVGRANAARSVPAACPTGIVLCTCWSRSATLIAT